LLGAPLKNPPYLFAQVDDVLYLAAPSLVGCAPVETSTDNVFATQKIYPPFLQECLIAGTIVLFDHVELLFTI
jgi:hypothetical protein